MGQGRGMYVEAEWSGDNAQDVQRETFHRIQKAFIAEAQALSAPHQMTMLKLGAVIIPKMVAAHSVLFQLGFHDRLDFDLPLSAICAAGADLLATRATGDESFRAAQLTYLSVGGLIDALGSETLDPVLLVRAGIEVGRADIRFTQVVTGLWEVMAEATVNAETVGSLIKDRQKGGAGRAAQKKAKADEWKAQALNFAKTVDHKHEFRSALATAIKFQFDEFVPEQRQIENWLEKEAEDPNGPLRSRARNKSA